MSSLYLFILFSLFLSFPLFFEFFPRASGSQRYRGPFQVPVMDSCMSSSFSFSCSVFSFPSSLLILAFPLPFFFICSCMHMGVAAVVEVAPMALHPFSSSPTPFLFFTLIFSSLLPAERPVFAPTNQLQRLRPLSPSLLFTAAPLVSCFFLSLAIIPCC